MTQQCTAMVDPQPRSVLSEWRDAKPCGEPVAELCLACSKPGLIGKHALTLVHVTVRCKECRHDHVNSFLGEGPQDACTDLDYDAYGQPDVACECNEFVASYEELKMDHEAEVQA